MTMMLQKAAATLALAALAASMGPAALAAGAKADVAAQAAAAAPAVQAAALHDDDPTVTPPDPTGPNYTQDCALAALIQAERERLAREQAEEEARRQQAAAAEEARGQQEERERIARELAAQAAATEVAVGAPAPRTETEIEAPQAIIEIAEAPTLSDEFVVPAAPAETETPAETPAAVPELTPEQLAALQRLFGQNAAYKAQIEAQQRAKEQAEHAQQLPDLSDKYKENTAAKNTGTEEQAERLEQFLAEHPHGSTWDERSIYKNYGACAAFAMQAQQTIFGEDADYTCSDRYEDIRQYSAVKVRLTSGTHWVFILEVNEDGSFRTADGNVNGKVRIGFDRTLDANSIIQVWNPKA